MNLLDQFGRVLDVGDSVVPKDPSVQNWVIANIEDSGISPAPGQPPVVKVILRCELTMVLPNMGQPVQALPLYLIKKSDTEKKPNLVVMN
jgi:hypothetical protein